MSHVEQYHTVWRLHPCNLHVRLATLDGKCCMLTTKSWCIVACDRTCRLRLLYCPISSRANWCLYAKMKIWGDCMENSD